MHCQGSEFKTTVNSELHTELFSQLFYSSSITFCFEHSLDKAPTLLLIFLQVAKGQPLSIQHTTLLAVAPKRPVRLLLMYVSVTKFPLHSFNVRTHSFH